MPTARSLFGTAGSAAPAHDPTRRRARDHGDCASLASLALTVIAVGIGSAVLLFALSLSPAMDVRFQNTAWRAYSGIDSTSAGTQTLPATGLLISATSDAFRGTPLLHYTVVALGDDPPLPPGVGALPGPGQTIVSSALSKLIAGAPADQLGDRFGTIVGDDR